jgi:uncharacterized DUF497 family protein
MQIEFDPLKRRKTLDERGLDMARTEEIFAGAYFTFQDQRRDYGEPRYISIGFLDGRMVAIAWTPRGDALRVISMRKCNEREQEAYGPELG